MTFSYKWVTFGLVLAILYSNLPSSDSPAPLTYMLASLRNKMSTTTIQQQSTAASTIAATSSHPILSRSVAKKVLAIEQAEGVGARVRRSIGTPSLKNISPFLMLDHFKVGEGAGFPDHPHRGQTTVTYMLEGFFNHEDFAGHAGKIGPGDL
jgi:hypothetical protein